MKAGIAASVVLAGAFASGSAMADGNNLLTQCQAAIRFINNNNDSTNEFGQGKCLGVVSAVVGLTMVFNDKLPKESKVCFPKDGITNGQSIRIVVKFLQDTPSLLHMPDEVLTKIALERAYPCK